MSTRIPSFLLDREASLRRLHTVIIEDSGSFVKYHAPGEPLVVAAYSLEFGSRMNDYGFVVAKQGPMQFKSVVMQL